MSAIVLPPIGDRRTSRPLPSIPNSHGAGSSKGVSACPTSYAFSSFISYMPAPSPTPLSRALQEPRVLINFLRYLQWHDFWSLALTCTSCRNLLHRSTLRDVVLSAFVPGYQYCLRHADLTTAGDIEVRFGDLSHFMVSQQLSLHHYPTHALATLSAPVQDERANRYIALCQAHSRMVLRLQALVHSSLSPVSEELEDPALRYRSTAQQVGRELVFPAPLFFSTEEKNRSHGLQLTARRRHIRFFSLPTTSAPSPRPLEDEPVKRSRSRLSVLGRRKVPLPPPSPDPLGLKLYAGSWRGWRRAVAASCSASEDDETLFRRPSRQFVCTTDSSRSSTDNSHGNSPSPHSSRLTEFIPTSPTVRGPHDIRVATSRFRAPILRVYFPCSELDQDAITACEAQLDDAGLWQHLSVGDVVCNLGYLPSEEKHGSSSELSTDGKQGPESWMIFDGMGLVPYTPSTALPLSEPLTLPSPFYYAHIIPPPFNPRFVAILPHEEPELSLAHLPARVRSPNSPNGFARIKKHMWLAHVRSHSRPDFGEGWQCAWILEGDGTKEGRQLLLDALCGDASGEREWELIMEKCTTARIWLRLLSTPTPHSPEIQ